MNEIQKEVKELVAKCGLTVAQLSREINVTTATVYGWINGLREPSKSNMNKLKLCAEGKLKKHNLDNEFENEMRVTMLEVMKKLNSMYFELNKVSSVISTDKDYCNVCGGSGHFYSGGSYIKCEKCNATGMIPVKQIIAAR